LTPLVKAAASDKLAAVKLLLEYGADPLVRIKDQTFLTVAITASFLGSYHQVVILRLVLEALDKKIGRQELAKWLNDYDLNSIVYFLKKDKIKPDRAVTGLGLLLHYGCDPSVIKHDWTALHICARFDLWKAQAILLRDPRTNAEAPKEDGFVPVFLAASNGNKTSLTMLLSNGASPTPVCDGKEAIMAAENHRVTALLHRAKVRQEALQAIAKKEPIPEEPVMPKPYTEISSDENPLERLTELLRMLMR
jgi:hypothetical protein